MFLHLNQKMFLQEIVSYKTGLVLHPVQTTEDANSLKSLIVTSGHRMISRLSICSISLQIFLVI